MRYEAYQKLKDFDIRIEDFGTPETKMLIIKEGATDQDQRVVAACIEFLTPSIVHDISCGINESELKNNIKQKELAKQSQRKSNVSLIHNNKSRRNSEVILD